MRSAALKFRVPLIFFTKPDKILTPYPGVVFTPSSIYKTPAFKDDGTIWDYDDLSLHCAETLSTIPAEQILQSKLNAFASRTESQPKISVTEVGRSGVGGDDYFDKSIDSPEDAEDAGNRNSSTPGSSFRVQTEVFKGTHLSSSSKLFQTIEINGIVEVKVSSCNFIEHNLTTNADDSWAISTKADSIQISCRIQKAQVSI